MSLEQFIMALLLGIPAYYVLQCLLLEQKENHEGPFATSHLTVLFPEKRIEPSGEYPEERWYAEHKQRVALWDWLRRPFGVYDISGNTWAVNEKRAERFTCPFCLSFWAALPFSAFFSAVTGLWLWFIVVHLGIAVVSRLVYEALNASE